MNKIGFRSWEFNVMQDAGVMGGEIKVSTTTFEKLDLGDEDVCIYGGVGICDRTDYQVAHDTGALNVETFFCGFDVSYNSDWNGDVTSTSVTEGCSEERSKRMGYMCATSTECPNGGDYGIGAHNGLMKRQKGYNCNVKPVDYGELQLGEWSHEVITDADAPILPYNALVAGTRTQKQNGGYTNKYYWEMGPFEAVMDASNPGYMHSTDGTVVRGPVIPIVFQEGGNKDRTLIDTYMAERDSPDWDEGSYSSSSPPVDFMALKPVDVDVCINFCNSEYEWSIYKESSREKPRQFACMNGTWYDQVDNSIRTGCNQETDAADQTWDRAPMQVQEHNTHMYCGWGLDITPFRCCRIVSYGRCEDDKGGCYSSGAIDVNDDVNLGDHSNVHPHSYCGLKNQVQEEKNSNVFSRIENMVSVPNVVRHKCIDRKDLYECGSTPNAKNPNWPNEEPCVQPMEIIDGVAVSQDYYPKGRCDLLNSEGGFEVAWSEAAHETEGMPRRTTYVTCTDENCAWGPGAAIASDEDGNGPQMDASANTGRSVDHHHVILVDWLDSYGTSCGGPSLYEQNNYKCIMDEQLGSTCNSVYCSEDCTSTWICNGWGRCDDLSMERITTRTQEGYCYARFFEFTPVDGDVIKSEDADGAQETCHVAPLDALEAEREECIVGCDLISFQCRQCWCMQFTSDWENNRWTAAQEFAAVIDNTGLSCYNGLIGRGSPKPSELRSCRGKSCPGIWTTKKCFSQIRCDADCSHTRQYRDVFCANRYTHIKEDESLCISNPVGSDWELIMSMASSSVAFDFDAAYWEEDLTKSSSCASSELDRKMNAYNMKKFDQIKMCFGYGFTLGNPGFESDELAPNLSSGVNTLSAAQFTGHTGWETTYTAAASQQGLHVYMGGAPDGDRYIGLDTGVSVYRDIEGLRKGLKTTIRFLARSEDLSDMGSLEIRMLGNSATSITKSNIPSDVYTEYEFSFVPPSSGDGEIRFVQSGGRVFLDKIVVTSDGFELIGYEPSASSSRTLAAFDKTAVNSDVYAPDGFRTDMSAWEFGNEWDEMLIISGGSSEDVIDYSENTVSWFQFKPSQDPFGLSDSTITTMTISDLRTSNQLLENTVIDNGGSIMCLASSTANSNAYWSITGKEMEKNIEGKTDDGGCYRYDDDLMEPAGIYYGQDGFMGYVSSHDTFTAVDPTNANGPTVRMFVRQAEAHGSLEETQNNCVVYDFGEHVWQDATSLFTAGEILVGGKADFKDFNSAAFERVYGVGPAQDTCLEDGTQPKAGFNLNIDTWECEETQVGPGEVSEGIEKAAVLNGAMNTYARWGYVTKVSDTCEARMGNMYDGAVGLGLWGVGDGSGETGANRMSSGYMNKYADTGISVKKSTWVWITDTTQNAAVEGIQTFDILDHNKPGYTVLDGTANKFEVLDMCKQKCADLPSCVVGFYIKKGLNVEGQCWLSSMIANSTEVSASTRCDSTRGIECEAFEKKPTLQHVDSNAYIYESHMVLPGYGNWNNNNAFSTGTTFEIHDSSDKFSPIIFGPLTVREVISKQFSYGKQTYVYWQESDTNFDTLHSKDVFVHTATTDDLEMYGLPGKVVGCLYTGSSSEYRHPRSGRTAEALCNELNKKSDECHGFSCWKNPNLLMNGGFEETDGEASSDVPEWVVKKTSTSSLQLENIKFDVIDTTEESNAYLAVYGPKPFVCDSCIRFLHLLPETIVETTVMTKPGREYILSFFYTGKVCVGNTDNCNYVKKGKVMFDTEVSGVKSVDLAVNVEGWGGAPADGEVTRPFRWKHIMVEVTPAYKVSMISFEDTSEAGAMSGLLLDEVELQAAHPGDLGENEYDNVDHEECATYCTSENAGDCDFTVSAVTTETKEFYNMRVDRDWFSETICMQMDGRREEAQLCEMKLMTYAGVILSTQTTGGRQHYYSEADSSVMHIFGGMSDVVDQTGCTNCGQDAYGPWSGLDTMFAASNIIVFTYKIEFNTGITSILNVEVTGKSFEGSTFKLLSRAKTVLAIREVNLEIDSGVASAEAVFPTPQNFGMDCDNSEECKVLVPGSPVYEDTIFYFEESAGTSLERRRSNICIRTPVCELLGEGEDFSYDAITKKKNDGLHQCSDGIRGHLDCTDQDFFTNFEASKCAFYEVVDTTQRYGVRKASANSAFKFAVKPTQALTCVNGDAGSCTFTFQFGLHEFQQEVAIDQAGASCDVGGEDDEPAYIIEVSRTVGSVDPRSGEASITTATTQVVRLLDANKNTLLEVVPEQAIALEEEIQGQTRFIFFWADLYKDKTTSATYVRFGRDVPSMGDASPAIQDVTIGGDVIMQYKVPEDSEVLDVTHASVWSAHASTFEVCSDQYRSGKMPTDRSCTDLAHCACAWHTPIKWDDIYCNSNCGWGEKRRLVYCRMTEHATNTADCAENYGHDCIYEFESYNPHCEIRFYQANAIGNTNNLLVGPVDTSAPTLKYSEASVLYGTTDASAQIALSGSSVGPFDWDKLVAVSVMGAGCGVLLKDTNDNIVAKVEVPKGSEKAILADFTGVASQSGMSSWLEASSYNPEGCIDNEPPADGTEAYEQSCHCPSGCALSTLITTSLQAMELQDKATYFHKSDLDSLDISQFASGLFNTKSCDASEKMDTQIRCHEKRGCCTTCAFGDWGNECQIGINCKDGNCAPPYAWSWGHHIKDLIASYDNHEGFGGCDTGCDSVTARSITCEEQDWHCAEWVADEAQELNGYYLPKEQLHAYLDLTQTYQTFWGGPQNIVSISGAAGSSKPICKKKVMQATASLDALSRPLDATEDMPLDLLSAGLCAGLERVDDDTFVSKTDSCVAKFTTPLNMYQYAEGCPEQCTSVKWDDLMPQYTPPSDRQSIHDEWKGAVSGAGKYVDGGGESAWAYIQDAPAANQGIREPTWRWSKTNPAECSEHGDICHPVQMMGSADDTNILPGCKSSDETQSANHNLVMCSFDNWVASEGAFARWDGANCDVAPLPQGDGSVCIKDRKCGEKKYCCCKWNEGEPWMPCHGCGDVIVYRNGNGDPDEDGTDDGVWCMKYGSGSTGMDAPKVVHKECPISTLEEYNSCCPEPEFEDCLGRSCTPDERPATAKHCVAFDQCTYEWHVRMDTNICDTFTKCVVPEAWNADTRSTGSEEEQKSWCTGGPQRLHEQDGFVTYGLGACWRPTTLKHNPEFTTAYQSGSNTPCNCYYGGNAAVGNAVIYDNAIDTAQYQGKSAAGYCNPVQVDGHSLVSALHVAVGMDGQTSSTQLKGAIYTDGGNGAARGSPGHRVAITKEHSASGPKAWVQLNFPQDDSEQMVFKSEDHEGVSLTGGRYWICVFAQDSTTLWHTDTEVQPDGTPEGQTMSLCQTTESVQYDANTRAFPPLELPCVQKAGQISIYATVVPKNKDTYRNVLTACSSLKDCGSCSRAHSSNEEHFNEPCDWVSSGGAETCMRRSIAYQSGATQVTSCLPQWAIHSYLDLGNSWSCPSESATVVDYLTVMPASDANAQVPPSRELCAEACYFSNMHWVGWTGSYAAGFDPNTADFPSVNGRPDAISSDNSAFYCEGFNFVEGDSCGLLKDIHVAPGGGGAGNCFINKDNPNPCKFGSDNGMKWLKTRNGGFYFVSNDGFLTGIDMKKGVPTCGSDTNVFASPGWLTGKDGDTYMPDPSLTCDASTDTACEQCLWHALARSMVPNTLSASDDSSSDAKCQLMTSNKNTVACTERTAQVECPSGTKIEITEAHYGGQAGSSSCTIVPEELQERFIPYHSTTGPCWNDVTAMVQTECTDSHLCEIDASSTLAAGESCANVYSYADISWNCVKIDQSDLESHELSQ
jgi:hypothetical protein